MKIKELSAYIDSVSRTSMKIAAGFMVFALSPLPYVALCLTNQTVISANNSILLSVAWFLLSVVTAFALLLTGLKKLSDEKKQKRVFSVSERAAGFFELTLRKWKNGVAMSFVIAAICLLLCAVPISNLFIVRSSGGNTFRYVAVMFAEVMLLLAFGFYALISRCARYTVLKRCSVTRDGNFDKEDKSERVRYSIGSVIAVVFFWAVTTAVYIGASLYLGSYTVVIIIWPIAAMIFIVWMTAGFPFGRYSFITKKRGRSKVVRIAAFILAMGCLAWLMGKNGMFYLTSYIGSVERSETHGNTIGYDPDTGVYTVRAAGDDFRVLQITDVHIGGSFVTKQYDLKALNTVYTLIRRADPDLIIVTGDILYPMPYQTLSYNNYLPLVQFCMFMEQIGIPWAFTYGNHDTEVFATDDYQSINKTLLSYAYGGGESCLLFAGVQPDITGRYNQYIRIENSDGSLNRLLFLIDSNAYVEPASYGQYDNIHQDQIDWYESVVASESLSAGHTVKSMAFFHIPMCEYAEAIQLYFDGSDEAEYLFGQKAESVSHPQTDDLMFETMVRLGSTQAVFVGHDHVNTFGVKYKGIDLVYGMSVDYYVYPGIDKKTAQRGAMLITLGQDGVYAITQLPYVS